MFYQGCARNSLFLHVFTCPYMFWAKKGPPDIEREGKRERERERGREIKAPGFPACPQSLQRNFRFKPAWVRPLLLGAVVLGPYAGPCCLESSLNYEILNLVFFKHVIGSRDLISQVKNHQSSRSRQVNMCIYLVNNYYKLLQGR